MDSEEQLPPRSLPIIPVGAAIRPPRNQYLDPGSISMASQLPGRLFLGSLDPDSFVRTSAPATGWRRWLGMLAALGMPSPGGWSARYVDASPGTYMDVSYAPKKGRDGLYPGSRGNIGVRMCFLGEEAGYRNIPDDPKSPRESWGRLTLWQGFPAQWDRQAREQLTASYNLQYVGYQAGAEFICYLPDGPMKFAVCHVPAARLQYTVDCMESMEKDPSLTCTVQGIVRLNTGEVVIWPDDSAGVEPTPKGVYDHLVETHGLPPLYVPAWRTLESGGEIGRPEWQSLRPGIHAVRAYFTFVVLYSLRDESRVIARLHQYGFVGSKADARRRPGAPDSVECTALVLHCLPAFMRASLEVDDGRSRLAIYNGFLEADQLPGRPDALAPGELQARARAQIAGAQTFAAELCQESLSRASFDSG